MTWVISIMDLLPLQPKTAHEFWTRQRLKWKSRWPPTGRRHSMKGNSKHSLKCLLLQSSSVHSLELQSHRSSPEDQNKVWSRFWVFRFHRFYSSSAVQQQMLTSWLSTVFFTESIAGHVEDTLSEVKKRLRVVAKICFFMLLAVMKNTNKVQLK